MKLGPDPVFDEEFELDDIPPDVFTVTVTVFNKVNFIRVLHCTCYAIVPDTVCTVCIGGGGAFRSNLLIPNT